VTCALPLAEYNSCTRYHSHHDPFSIVLPKDVTIIYLFCDPINAFLSHMKKHAISIIQAAAHFYGDDDENNPRVVEAQKWFRANGFFENHCINMQCSLSQVAEWRSFEAKLLRRPSGRPKGESS